MTKALLFLCSFSLLICSNSGAARSQETELTEEVFQELHSELQTPADELWRTIPWRLDLLDAKAVAADQRKPIFIWAMDGHPLGCT